MEPLPHLFKSKQLGEGHTEKPIYMHVQVPDSFFQAASSPSGWLGRKCFSHFRSHKITTKHLLYTRQGMN